MPGKQLRQPSKSSRISFLKEKTKHQVNYFWLFNITQVLGLPSVQLSERKLHLDSLRVTDKAVFAVILDVIIFMQNYSDVLLHNTFACNIASIH